MKVIAVFVSMAGLKKYYFRRQLRYFMGAQAGVWAQL